jgi:hypothetical protein
MRRLLRYCCDGERLAQTRLLCRTGGRGVSKSTVRIKVWRAFETGCGGRLIAKAFVHNGQQNE